MKKIYVLIILASIITNLISVSFAADNLPAVIFENNNLSVTIKKIDEENITLEIANSSNEDLEFSMCGISVNGCMLYISSRTKTVTSGKKILEKYKLKSKKDYGISSIESIGIGLRFWTGDTKYVIGTVQLVDEPQFFFTPDAKLFYEDEYIQAYLKCSGTNYKDMEIIYYNKSETMLYARLIDTAFNDIMISSVKYIFESDDILSHCYYRTNVGQDIYLTVWSALEDEIKENELEPIETISCKIEEISLVDRVRNTSEELTINTIDFME